MLLPPLDEAWSSFLKDERSHGEKSPAVLALPLSPALINPQLKTAVYVSLGEISVRTRVIRNNTSLLFNTSIIWGDLLLSYS